MRSRAQVLFLELNRCVSWHFNQESPTGKKTVVHYGTLIRFVHGVMDVLEYQCTTLEYWPSGFTSTPVKLSIIPLVGSSNQRRQLWDNHVEAGDRGVSTAPSRPALCEMRNFGKQIRSRRSGEARNFAGAQGLKEKWQNPNSTNTHSMPKPTKLQVSVNM